MKRFLFRLSIPLGLLLLLAFLLDPLFTSVFREGQGTKAQWLMGMRDQRFDVAVIGSSRAWWNISMDQLDSACGTRSISLANNHFTPAEMLLAMKAFLRNGNRARVLLLQVDHSSLTDEQDGFSSTVYDFVPFLEDTLVYAHLAPRGDEWFWLRHVPYWRYAKYDFKWGVEQAVLTAWGRRNVPFDATGSYFSPNDRFYGKAGVPYAPSGHRMGEDLRALFALCEQHGITVLFDRASAKLASGIAIGFVDGPGGGFRIDNPNLPARVGTLTPAELQKMLTAKVPLRLLDVRTERERTVARIAGDEWIEELARTELNSLSKDTMLVVYCHHGTRSHAAAEQLVASGFRNVWNLSGGIDAWSRQVDPSVARY